MTLTRLAPRHVVVSTILLTQLPLQAPVVAGAAITGLVAALAGGRHRPRGGGASPLVRRRAGLVDAHAAEAVDVGRHPGAAITGEGRARLRVANPNPAGITLAEVRLVEDVDRAVEDAGIEERTTTDL